MTPPNETAPIPVELAVAIGRIEEKLNAMSTTENKTGERLDKMETRLSRIELNFATNVRPRTPWYLWVAGLGGIAVLGLNGFALLQLLGDLAAIVP